jgi:hypothetical protein
MAGSRRRTQTTHPEEKRMIEDSTAEREEVAEGDRQNGYKEELAQHESDLARYEEELAQHESDLARYEEELAQYESDLARYLQARIKPGLSSGAIPLMARSIAKEITRKEPPEPPDSADGSGDAEQGRDEASDFEADMHELQAELGEDWILRFSVQGEDGWLTAEKKDASQRVEAPDKGRLIRIVEAINEDGGRQG